MKKWLKRIGIGLLIVLLVGLTGFAIYTLDYSRAKPSALEVYTQSTQQSSSIHAFLSPASTIGIIFYPGGKVDSKAYSPLCLGLSDLGYSTFLVDMPFNLAVFDIDAANRVRKLNPQIKTWFIAGHSLGGAMAYTHYDAHPNDYAGIILLAAYPLNQKDRPYLILKGSNDTVLDSNKLNGFKVQEILGGNHAQFGDYGHQKGDGIATISAQAQKAFTLSAIQTFIQDSLNS